MAPANSPKIAILISTFNGERWLSELMRSLVEQSLPFELIWRDDGSSDQTLSLVRGFEWQKLTEVQHSNAGQNIGACASFGLLMQAALLSDAELFFFADQDDVWRNDKLSIIVERFEVLADNFPHLIHHDLRVVAEDGAEISPSLWRYMGLAPDATELRHYLTRNSVTGCAAAFNRSLLEISCPVPMNANMHDWWLALVASAFGKIETISSALVDYRQHSANALGAKSLLTGLNPLTNWRKGWNRGNLEYKSLFPQADALSQISTTAMSERDRILLSRFAALPRLPLFERLITAHKLGLRDRHVLLWLVAMLRVGLNP